MFQAADRLSVTRNRDVHGGAVCAYCKWMCHCVTSTYTQKVEFGSGTQLMVKPGEYKASLKVQG